MKPLSLFAILLLLSSVHFAQSVAELQTNIRTDVEQGRLQSALSSLKALEQKHPDVFRAEDYDYLAARVSIRAGDLAAASAWLLANAKRGSILKPYALFHLSEIARSSGNLVLERTYLDEISATAPGSLIAGAARNRRARSWFESGNFEMAARAFEVLLAGTPLPPNKIEDALTRENRFYLARSQMAAGDEAARNTFAALISATANPAQPDDFALAAVKALDKLDVGPEAKVGAMPSLSDYEHLRRASTYQFNREFADARRHYAAIIRDHPSSGIIPDAIYQTGRSYSQESNFSEAIHWFERAVEQFPDHQVSRDALLQAGNAYTRVGKHVEGVRRYQDFIAKYPGDDRLDRAYMNVVDILRDQGEETEALKWSTKVQELFRGKTGEALGTFAEVRINLAKNDWAAALVGLDRLLTMPELGGATVAGGTTRQEVAFLRGFVLEQQRNFPAAIDAYLSITDGRNEYYGGRATERLQSLAGSDASRPDAEAKFASLSTASKDPETSRRNIQAMLRLAVDANVRERLLSELRNIYAGLPGYKSVPSFRLVEIKPTPEKSTAKSTAPADAHRATAARLAFLGLYDEAAPELEASRSASNAATDDLGYTAAVFHERGDRGYKAAAFAEPLWRTVPADYQVELISPDQIALLYPSPYHEVFLKHATPRGVDPRFLLSIVRQESRFRPDIKSNAAARGMMQFISTTSNKVAAQLQRKDFDQDELYDPSTAILFGSQYVADLFKLFPNQPHAVAGSYNGGEDNIRRWMNRSRSDAADRYVPEIAFSQTKDYVYKVMANYRVYRMFYGEDLAAKAIGRE